MTVAGLEKLNLHLTRGPIWPHCSRTGTPGTTTVHQVNRSFPMNFLLENFGGLWSALDGQRGIFVLIFMNFSYICAN